MSPRCWCGHPHDLHEHLRRGSDCSQCGTLCPAYAPRSAPMPPTHALVAAYSDAWTYRNLAALAPYALRRETPLVPPQRRSPTSIAGQYAQHLRSTRRQR